MLLGSQSRASRKKYHNVVIAKGGLKEQMSCHNVQFLKENYQLTCLNA